MKSNRTLERLIEMSADEFNSLLWEKAGDIIEEYLKEDVERSTRTLRYARETCVRGHPKYYDYHYNQYI